MLRVTYLISAVLFMTAGAETCEYRKYCTRHRDYDLGVFHGERGAVEYNIAATSVSVIPDKAQIKAELWVDDHTGTQDLNLAKSLNITFSFYKHGIMRVLIEDPLSDRFRISQEQGISVQEEQLVPLIDIETHLQWQEDGFLVNGYSSDDGKDSYEFSI